MAEKRRHVRLPVKLELLCRKVGQSQERPYNGRTVNVSCGGLFFETADGTFEQGQLVSLELSVPPTSGLLEFGGRISGFARVRRVSAPPDSSDAAGPSADRYGVAVEFCEPLRLGP